MRHRYLAFLFFTFIVTHNLHAETLEINKMSYKEAKSADVFVRFDMASTKFGLITTSFSGFARKFKVSGDIKNDVLQAGAQIEFAVKDLDTDINGRNEKMWSQCLDEKNHPTVRLTLNQAVPLTGELKDIPATLNVRGADKNIVLKVKSVSISDNISFDISGSVSIKELQIPDPSIAIASVRDRIDIVSHLVVARTK